MSYESKIRKLSYPKTLTIRLSLEQFQLLKQESTKKHMPISFLIREILNEKLANF